MGFRLIAGVKAGSSRILQRAASGDDPRAQHQMAQRYIKGSGVQVQLTDALKLLIKSAEAGYAPAQVDLGHFFRDGIIVQKHRIQAADWYGKAAKQGYADGLFLMGACYESGSGVPAYLPKAYGFYLLASAAGHPDAQNYINSILPGMPDAQQASGIDFSHEYAQKHSFTWFEGNV